MLHPVSEALAAGDYRPCLDFEACSEKGEEDDYHTEVEEDDEDDTTRPSKRRKKAKTKGKQPDRRNATSMRVGTDADIGYIGRRVDIVGTVPQINKGWREDGTGPPVTMQAGILLTHLLAIFSERHTTSLMALISYLQDPAKEHRPLSGKTEMNELIADLVILETNAQANDLLYMCKLIQLVLNVDQ